MELVRQLLSVFFVLMLVGLSVWWLRRRTLSRAGIWNMRKRGQAKLESLERLPLGTQHVLHLVRVGERTMVIAVHPAGCTVVEDRPLAELEKHREAAAAGLSGAVR